MFKAKIIFLIMIAVVQVEIIVNPFTFEKPAKVKTQLVLDDARSIIYEKVLENNFYDIDRAVHWLTGIAIRESGVKYNGTYYMNIVAEGLDGEYGFMQPIPATVETYNWKMKKNFSIEDMENPTNCAEVCVWYFKKCLTKYKRYDRSVMAYNAGINRKKYINVEYYYLVRRFASEASSHRYVYADR